ncbi:MAG: DUF4258 domain-containing protein [Chloroflexota bacterium]|nr:DUF4258 domain-containing protein [Chloroflexota bacterium]
MSTDPPTTESLFEVFTPLGFTVRVSKSYWQIITTIKHPVMAGREADVQATLQRPETIRQSRSDAAVYLFYRTERVGRWTCAVAKRLNGDGFLITTYVTDAIKEGTQIWPT